jgi:hypothetical protein
LIFPSSNNKPIDATLLPMVQKIEERSPMLRVYAAREFRYPVQQQAVSLRVDRYQDLKLLEKFVLRASAEVSPAPSLTDVANALGMNPVFIQSTYHNLVARQSILADSNRLQITDKGREARLTGRFTEEPRFETWYFIQDTLQNIAMFTSYPLDTTDEEILENLDHYVKKELTQFPTFEQHPAMLGGHLRELGLDLHNPEEGSFVTQMVSTTPPQIIWKQIAIYMLYNTINDKVNFQVRGVDRPLPQISMWIESQLQAQNISLPMLFGVSEEDIAQKEAEQAGNDPVVEANIVEIRRRVTSELLLQVEGQKPVQSIETAIQLRDVEIRPAFLKALEEAQEQIIIYSPWVNEQAVDDDFVSLLETLVKKGVRILIGHGIGQHEQREDRPIPPALQQRLRAIRTMEGTPGIITEWLGNSHAKEVIIDRKIHFNGSHNWLSYRGDHLPRGETVYQVTIVSEVEKAYNHLAQRFLQRAQKLWAQETVEERRRALCIDWYLGYELEALMWILRDGRYSYTPFWLTLARQAIYLGQAERLPVPLQMLIKFCCATPNSQHPGIIELIKELKNILKLVKRKNNSVFIKFTNDNRVDLQQLGIDF